MIHVTNCPAISEQQIKRIIDELKTAARPANSKVLVLPDSLISTAKAQRSQRKSQEASALSASLR
jgi:hypothetical protein